MKSLLIIVAVITTQSLAMAAGEYHGDGVPRVVLYQAINVALLLFGMWYVLRKPISQMFEARRKDFLANQERAMAALKKAETEYNEIKGRLDKLEATTLDVITKAKVDANDLKNQIIGEASALAKRMKDEASSAANVEIQRAKSELRQQLLQEAIVLAKQDISKKATKEDQARLQQSFISKVGGAQP